MSDLHQRAEFAADGGGKRRKALWVVAAALVVVAAGVGAAWYALTPHSAAEQLAEAEGLQAAYLREAGNLPADQRDARRDEVVEAFEKVFGSFEATEAETAAAYAKLADFEQAAGRPERARPWWERLIDERPDTPEGREAFGRLIDSYVQAARAKAASDRAAALELFEKAVGVAERFVRQAGAADPQAPATAMRRCRILHDDIREPAIRAIKALEEFLDTWPADERADEALLRLGRLHEQIAEPTAAAEYYKRLIDEHPHSEHLKDAERGRARAVSEFDPAAGERLWRELAAKYPADADLNREAVKQADRLQRAREAEQEAAAAEAAKKKADDSRAERFGGGGGCGGCGGHFDSGWGKPVPPTEMLKDFIEQKIDARHYRLNLRLRPAEHAMAMTGEVELVNEGAEKEDFLLMLGPLMEPGIFTLDGEPVTVVRPPGKAEVLHLKLSRPWPAGAKATLAFEYAAVVEPLELPAELNEKLLQEFGRLSRRPAAVVARGCSPAQLMSDPRLQFQLNDTGYALSGASWYPVTIFGDLFTAEIAITIPEGFTAICSGRRLAERGGSEGLVETQWRCEKPYFGLYLAYGPYERISRGVDGVDVSVCFLGDQADKAEAYLDEAEKVLRSHVTCFGAFAFEKLTLVQVELPPILGGVGPASLTFLHAAVVRNRETPPVNLLAHEIGHQWWGNKVPINLIDEGYSQWLSEGFATYSDALYSERSEGPEAFRRRIKTMADTYLERSATVREEAVADTFMGQSPLYRPVVYEKGALVLHALRYVLGDETFFNVLRHYAEDCAFRRSTVDDFRKLAARVSGRDLDWFFDEWLDRPGCPQFELSGVEEGEADPDGRREVVVRIGQPKTLSRTPVDLLVEGPDGRSRRVRATPSKKENTVAVEVDFPVVRVVLDPDGWVLHRPTAAGDVWAAADAAAKAAE